MELIKGDANFVKFRSRKKLSPPQLIPFKLIEIQF